MAAWNFIDWVSLFFVSQAQASDQTVAKEFIYIFCDFCLFVLLLLSPTINLSVLGIGIGPELKFWNPDSFNPSGCNVEDIICDQSLPNINRENQT